MQGFALDPSAQSNKTTDLILDRFVGMFTSDTISCADACGHFDKCRTLLKVVHVCESRDMRAHIAVVRWTGRHGELRANTNRLPRRVSVITLQHISSPPPSPSSSSIPLV